jgi:hypothetical protein
MTRSLWRSSCGDRLDLTVQDIAELADEEIIVLHRNRKPIRAKRMDWRNFPNVIRLATEPPVALPILRLLRICRLITRDLTSSGPEVCRLAERFSKRRALERMPVQGNA